MVITKTAPEFKAGFITLVGRPNVGKSTLLNYFMGQKVAIVSDKVQTTRLNVSGIRTTDHSQMIFLDTPGIHKPKHRLGMYLSENVENALQTADIILLLLSAKDQIGPSDRYIFELLKKKQKPFLVAINKIDCVKPHCILPLIDVVNKYLPCEAIVPISALNGEQVSILFEHMEKLLPEGVMYYNKESCTNQSLSTQISEFIREKILLHTKHEIPHSVAVKVEDISHKKNHCHIRADIYVERVSQKAIIIGSQGSMLKQIGIEARQCIELLLKKQVHLELWVKVKKDWRQDKEFLYQLGFGVK